MVTFDISKLLILLLELIQLALQHREPSAESFEHNDYLLIYMDGFYSTSSPDGAVYILPGGNW